MENDKPTLTQMLRAPFFSSIISPLFAGTLLAVSVNGSFSILGFLFVMIMGLALHGATNVYNDIYDTIQGTDKVNHHRNEFSGGSGVLVNYPDLFPKMYSIARICLILAFFATAALMLVVEKSLWPILWGLYFLSAFFSKYYTAAPVKLAYRGVGEISVWLAFGPMAILVAAVSQNVGFHPMIIAAMPITGISTLSILLLGQLIDLQADKATGKLGAAARKGPAFAAFLFVSVQLLLALNVFILSLYFVSDGWTILISLIPYLLLLPGISRIVLREYNHPDKLKPAAKKNVQLHLSFALLFSLGIGLSLVV